MTQNKKKKTKGLGKGIDALFSNAFEPIDEATYEEVVTKNQSASKTTEGTEDNNQAATREHVELISIDDVRPNPYQPRQAFDEEALRELADSIEENGLLQPIIVRKSAVKGYEIIAGERRTRAVKLLGVDSIPAIVRQLTDTQMMETAIIENLQREDLTPIEEAMAYRNLMDNLNLTQAQAAKRLGKSRSYVANMLRLLELNPDVKELVQKGLLSMGQARTLLGLKNKKEQSRLAYQVAEEGMTVRELEKKVQALNEPATPVEVTHKKEKPAYIRENEDRLMDKFGTTVQIKDRGDRGKIEIEYLSKDDLTRILDLLDIRIEDF
ncbi:MAG: ParB/RepB/Spo0J family partition protein [Aerococcus sp.]|nr:ParB/RepB/Spo0J family partition protein [Aerococcus sp.]